MILSWTRVEVMVDLRSDHIFLFNILHMLKQYTSKIKCFLNTFRIRHNITLLTYKIKSNLFACKKKKEVIEIWIYSEAGAIGFVNSFVIGNKRKRRIK